MKKYLQMLAAAVFLTATFHTPLSAQQTKSGAPVIPIPSGEIRKSSPKAGSAPKIQIGKAETTKLANGLTVIVVENHKLPQVSFRVFVDKDPVLEKETAGTIDLMGELLTKGTSTRSKSKIDEEVDFIGAFLSSDGNGVSGACLSKHSDKLLSIMADVLINPSFPQEELDKAKRRSESGLASSKDDAGQIASNVGAILRYGKEHPYGEILTEASLAKITLDPIKAHYNTYFKPNIAYLVVVGDITKAAALAKAEQFFGKWTGGKVPTHSYKTPSQPAKSEVDFVHKPGAVQSVINITYPVELPQNSPDAIAARVMNTILGGIPLKSRVDANLREGHGYTYGARTALVADELVGYFNANASVRNAVTDSSIIEFKKEMNKLRAEKVPAEELQVVKNVMTGQFSQSLEQPGTVATFALNTALYGLPADYYEKYLQNLQAVTAEDIQRLANKYVTPDRAYILVVGNKDDVAERLKQFSADGKLRFFDAFGAPIQDNNVAIPAGVTAQTVLADYVNAIGGTKKIAELKDLTTKMNLKTPGPSFDMTIAQKDATKLAIDMTMNGQVLSHRVFDGEKAMESGMGGARPLEGEELTDMKEQALFCKEANYVSAGYQLALKGIEAIDGKNAYIIEVVRPDGKKSTEYYDMASSLKVREVSVQPGQDGEPATMTNDFGDYKAVNGVQFPHKITISGVFPVPMVGTVLEIKANTGISDTLFEVK
ncbi:MAG: insulinase family protein [Saprospiraceae bacterium]|nr:insulinase family protein [Saprospiraceae bacterium]